MSGSQDEIPPPPPPPPSSPQTPTQQTPHTVSTIKLPILKKGEYDIWAMKMEHYLAHTDYPIWEVIQNGNGPVSITTDTQGQIKVLPPRTAEEIVAREREHFARECDNQRKSKIQEEGYMEFLEQGLGAELRKKEDSKIAQNQTQRHILLGLKKVEATISCSFNTSVNFAEAQKEKEDLKAKVEKWHNSSKNLSKLLNTQMSANDKFGLGYGDHRYDGILSYENEVLQSVFMNKESELEKQPLYDRFVTADGMHVVPPPMTGNYMPSGPDIEVDYSQFTYGPKQTQPSESESQSSEFDTCESNISTEPSELVSEPVVNESNVECQLMTITHRALKNKRNCKGYFNGKGKIKTGKLDFEDVCFVKELQHFNLFSMSQMCDKKNKVLFTDSECLVLSPEFKLPDENQWKLNGFSGVLYFNSEAGLVILYAIEKKSIIEKESTVANVGIKVGSLKKGLYRGIRLTISSAKAMVKKHQSGLWLVVAKKYKANLVGLLTEMIVAVLLRDKVAAVDG
ncbi:hypothetical protein Tco_0272931 [Tanacetum coccineum]